MLTDPFPQLGLDAWREVASLLEIALPVILPAVVFWLQKYFVPQRDFNKYIQDHDKEHEGIVNGLGQRVKIVEDGIQRETAAIYALERHVDSLDFHFNELTKDVGELKVGLQTLSQVVTNKTSEILNAVHQLEREMIKLETRYDNSKDERSS